MAIDSVFYWKFPEQVDPGHPSKFHHSIAPENFSRLCNPLNNRLVKLPQRICRSLYPLKLLISNFRN